MATPSVLDFDAEGRAIDFEVWVDDLQLFLQCDRADGLSLFDLTSGASPTPAADADATIRSQWATRDAAARLAVRRHLPTSERAHFSQYKSAQTLYDAVVARYSSPATAALSRLMLPYLFPDLAAFPTVADLITHLRTSDTRYRAALPADFCTTNPPPMYITLGVLPPPCCPLLPLLLRPTSLVLSRSVRRLPLAGDAALARARGARELEERAVEVEVEAVGGVGVAVEVEVGVGGSVAAVEAEAAAAVAVVAEVVEEAAVEAVVEAAAAVEAAEAVEAVGVAVELVAGLCRGVAQVVARASSSSMVVRPCPLSSSGVCGGAHHTPRCFGRLTDAWRHQFSEASEIPRWDELSRAGVAIFDLDFDDILSAMYAVSHSDGGDCYCCFPPDPGIEAAALGACDAAALGASVSASSGTGESALSGTTSASASLTFTLDSGASRSFFRDRTTLTPLSRPVAVSLADPSGGPVLSRFSTVLPCPAAPSGTLSGLYLPSFSTNLVSGADLQEYTSSLLRRAAPHSPQFPPTEAPLQTLHMDVWGPARVRGQGHERYFLLVVDDYSRYTTVFPLRSKGDVTETFTLPDSPQQNGIAERRIGMVMDVARTSMMHAAAPHFLWPFAVRYAAHQLNLHPRVSRPETSPALLWTGKVGDASAFRVWGSQAFVRDLSADKLSPRAAPCVFLGFPPDAPGWQFYHPTSRRVLSSQDVTFDESVPYYRLFPYRTPSLPPPPLFLVDAVEPVEVTGDSGAAEGAAAGGVEPEAAGPGGAGPGGAASGGVEPGGAEPGGTTSGGAEPGGAERGFTEPGGAEPGGATLGGTACGGAPPGGSPGASSRREPLSPQELREWFARRWRRPAGAGGSSAAEGAAVAGPGGARTGSTGAAGPAGSTGAGAAAGVGAETAAGGPAGGAPGAAGGSGAAGGAAGAGAPTEGTGAVPAASGVATRPRPYFIPLLQQVLGLPPSTGPPPSLECPQPVQPQLQLQPTSLCLLLLPTLVLLEVLLSVVSLRLALRRLSVLLTLVVVVRSSLPALPDPESDSLRAASPTVTRLLATLVTDPSFESTAASALVAELVDFAARCRLDYAASLVAESESVCPPSVGGECALGTDVLEDRQEEFQCLAAASPYLVSVLLTPEGDPDALDIPTPRSYAEAIEGPYSSQWQAAMDAGMASWKSTGTYVDAVLPRGANIVSGMWIFRVKRPPGSPPVFKARYVARGFSQRQGVDYFQTFSPTPKMTTLRVLLHVAAYRDYELHSLDFSTAFLQGSLHEEIWLRRPPGFSGSFPPGTQWSLRRPVYGLRQAPREWHDTLRTTLAALGFVPSTADPSLFLRTDTSLPPFYILVYVDDLVFATADTAGLAYVKSELQKRHTCTDLGELRSYLGLQITRDRARRTITLTQSHMVQQVLQRFGFTYSSPQATPLPTRHSLSALPSNESVESSGPYPELVGCLMYLMTCTRPDLAYPLSILARYVAPGRHRPEHMAAAKRVLRYLCSTSGMGLVLGGRSPVVLTGHADASWADDQATQRSSQGYTFSLGSGSELRWLTYLLTDLGEPPRSPPVLYVDNKAMLALCREQRLEHITKHIALRYFLARKLQQRGQLRLAYVASEANTADVFTKALAPCDHQRFCTQLGLVPVLPHLLSS
ncbi:unnamed protein product [Closterium sp. NIES-64]|nr:unnamed protein product [Closterium sp. NIES-64]